MPIEACTLPNGGSGFRWGARGKCYADRADAERQEAAARAHGWAADEKPRTMYVSRKLTNADALITWAKEHGFTKPMLADQLHVTIAYSKTPVQWTAAGDSFDNVRVSAGGSRSIEQLGTEGAVVLRFDSAELRHRWQEFREIGASWDFEGYKPHVTFTYEPGDVDLSKVKPYDGPLEFGPEHYAEIDEDWAKKVKGAMDSADRFAFDKASVRTIDQDGRMRVEVSNISKATVNEYLGSEIPDAESLGLDPKRTYRLLRDPDELAKAVDSFNGIPLLNTHVPSTAWDHPKGKVVGTTGTDAVFEKPYLKNSLIVWTAEAIQGIESDEQRELSSAYRYRADMTPGTYDGVQYDGVMRDILGNHVALVPVGRAGPDVIVGDSLPGKGTGMTKVKALSRRAAMAQGALMVALKPTMLAADAKLDYGAMLQGVTSKNWAQSKPKILEAIKPKLAKDAEINLEELLDAVGKQTEGMDDDPDTSAAPAVDADDPAGKIMAMLKGKVGDDVIAAVGEMLKAMKPAGAADDTPKPGEDPAKKDDMVSKTAMDAALKAEREAADKRIKLAADEAEQKTIARLRSIREAEDHVQPYVGKLAGAFDSAEAVYRAALTNLGVEHKDIHPSALRVVLEAQPKPGHTRTIAQDSAPSADFAKRFPGAAAIRTV